MAFLFLTVTVFWIVCVSRTDGLCSKFVARDGRGNPVTFNDICYYPFPIEYTYSGAKSLCESEGARLPVLDTEAKQVLLHGMIGFVVSLYWTSLEYTDNKWYWVDGSNKYPVAEPRWIGTAPSNPTYAFATDRQWVRIDTPVTKQVVCEDDHTPPTVQAVLVIPFRQSGCNAMSLARNLKEIKIATSPSVIDCAAICVDTISCEYLKYNSLTSQCHLYTSGGSVTVFDCFMCTS